MLDRFFAPTGPAKVHDAGRAAIGAIFALACAAGASLLTARYGANSHWLLIPPVAASAVLLFSIPASPLAQPRAILGGNFISSLIGLAAGATIPHPAFAGVLAVGVAIWAMSVLRCLHPPGGAIALAAALGGAWHGLGDAIAAVAPVVLASAMLVATAMAYVTLTGRSYPHRLAPAANPHATRDPPALQRIGFTAADLDQALAHYGERLDVSREDLDALFQEVELQAHARLHGRVRCDAIMSRDVVVLTDTQPTEAALAELLAHDLRAAPVLDDHGHVVGLARRAELAAAPGLRVEAVLERDIAKVAPGQPIQALLPLLSSGRTHEVAVVDGDAKLLGLITQTDLIAVLFRAHLVEHAAPAR
jgi:CBS domain-containing membrane protein